MSLILIYKSLNILIQSTWCYPCSVRLTLLKNLSWNLFNVRCMAFVLISIKNFKTWHFLHSYLLLFVSPCISHLMVPAYSIEYQKSNNNITWPVVGGLFHRNKKSDGSLQRGYNTQWMKIFVLKICF